MTVQNKEYAGGAAATTLASGINSGATSISLTDGSTFPSGSTAPFVICIDRGTASEEKILITSRSTNTLTVTTRGYDGSTAASHSSGATVEHTLDATSLTDCIKAAVQTIAKVTTAGDVLVGTGSEAMKRLGLGTARQNLSVNSAANDLTYQDSLQSILTTQGDLPYASAANTLARLAKGTARQALLMNAGATAPEWGASLASTLTAKGDIATASAANTPARQAVGSDGAFLKADSAQANGLAWDATPLLKTLVDAKGDLLGATAADTPARVAVGTNQQKLVADSSLAPGLGWSWGSIPVFADTTARDAAITAPTTNDWAWLSGTGILTHYSGSAWVEWGIEGAWTSYTPTLTASTTSPTLGTGSTSAGAYMRVGRTIHWRARIAFGSSGAAAGSGTYRVALPVTPINVSSTPAQIVGQGVALDNSTSAQNLVTCSNSDGNGYCLLTVEAATAVSDSSPWTWAAQDGISVAGTFEAAA